MFVVGVGSLEDSGWVRRARIRFLRGGRWRGRRVFRRENGSVISRVYDVIFGVGVSWDRRDLFGVVGMIIGSRMLIVRVVFNGRCFWCLVDIGSERTLVSSRVVVG